jgi:hypothetical protein
MFHLALGSQNVLCGRRRDEGEDAREGVGEERRGSVMKGSGGG